MLHEDILYISYHKCIKNYFLIINNHLDNFKGDFLNI